MAHPKNKKGKLKSNQIDLVGTRFVKPKIIRQEIKGPCNIKDLPRIRDLISERVILWM